VAREQTEPATTSKPMYRRFVYLDADEIMNSLSSVEGGAVEKATKRILQNSGADVAASFELGGMKLQLGGRNGKEVERQVELRQTIHSGMSALLQALSESRQIRRLRENGEADFAENTLVEFDAHVYLCRSPALAGLAKLNAPPRDPLWRRLLGTTDVGLRHAHERHTAGLGDVAVAIADVAHPGVQPLVLVLKTAYLLVPAAGFCRRMTVVGQVEGSPLQDEATLIEVDDRGTTLRVSIARQDAATEEIKFVGAGGGLAERQAEAQDDPQRQLAPATEVRPGPKTIEIRRFDGQLPLDPAVSIRRPLIRPLCVYK